MSYLGMPLGSSYKASMVWNSVAERMDKKLAGWKRLYLSKGGKITLTKSTLSNLFTYYMSLFTIPTHVANRLERLQREFLWGVMNDVKKIQLVEWEKVCSNIREGGLAWTDPRGGHGQDFQNALLYILSKFKINLNKKFPGHGPPIFLKKIIYPPKL